MRVSVSKHRSQVADAVRNHYLNGQPWHPRGCARIVVEIALPRAVRVSGGWGHLTGPSRGKYSNPKMFSI